MRRLDRFEKFDILIGKMRIVLNTLKVNGCLLNKENVNAVSKYIWHKSYNTFDSIQERSGG